MFCKILRYARIKRNMTQQAMADAVNLALRSYQCYEQGTREPSLTMLTKLAEVLQVPTDYLLGRDLSILRNFEGL